MGFVFTVALFFLVLYGLVLALLYGLNRRWWRLAWVRRAATWTPVVALASGLCWRLGADQEWNWLVFAGAGFLSVLLLCMVGLLAALLVTGLVHSLEKLHDAWRYPRSPVSLPERRRFLRLSLAALPALTTATAAKGILSSATPARIPEIPLYFPGLPPALQGLKILQFSDIHIGPYIHLGHLEELLTRAAAHQPDLVLVTGDLCDDVPVYRDTIRLIEGLHPPLGTFASLGNHEYFRGLKQIKQHFARSTIPLLVDEGLILQKDGTPFFLGGIDDPRTLRSPDSYSVLQGSVERTLQDAPAGVFRILMSHRAQALDFAAPLGVELVLAGHTHGFQMGYQGRSLFESWMPERYAWGLYRKEGTQLYTSAGVGHWFPFRLGCPPEAPLFTLQQT
ncbi:MAG: metallophosphoesterase [Candidatus Latescibacteria bacterium]|nr:metallophosphoesterase [Candidatus Latescibacterota bacterium]